MIIFLIAVVILICILMLSFYCYRVGFYVKANHQSDPYALLQGAQYQQVADQIYASSRIMEKVPFEPVRITAQDGTKLFGRYYDLRKNAPVEILMHGYRSCALRDCSGGHYLSRKMGFNSLVVDQRCHGESEGNTITFGVMERLDCLSWIKYINERLDPKPPIILSGLSMGAATVLAAADLDLPENVVCIMADSPYTSPKEIICKVCADSRLPVKLVWPFIYLGARIFGRFSPTESSALESVKHAKIPILLIHGEDDRYVPCHMSHEIAEACASTCRLHTFTNAGHGLCYMVNPFSYEKIVYAFLSSIPQLEGAIDGNPVEQEPN